MVVLPERRAVFQKGLDRLEKWADRYLTKFNKKCKVLLTGRDKPRHRDLLGS